MEGWILISMPIGIIVLYFIIKAAVKNGIIEAYDVIKTHEDSDEDDGNSIEQTSCPQCGSNHDIDCLACPSCGYKYKEGPYI